MTRDAKRQKTTSVREWSLVEEAARCIIERTQTANERASLPLREGDGWIQRLRELQLLRKPLTFDQLMGCGSGWCCETQIYATRDKTEAYTHERGYYLAMSDHVMRGGKHFANFTLGGFGNYVRVGVMRPIKNCDEKGISNLSLAGDHGALFREKNERWGDGVVNFCNYNFFDGICQWSDWDNKKHPHSGNFRENWPGMEGIQTDDVAGLLLDLDEGTLTVYKNGSLLGVMKSGLDGEYCWAVDFYCGFDDGPSVKIARGNIPV